MIEPKKAIHVRELVAIMDGDKCIALAAKNPDRPAVLDITEDIYELVTRIGKRKK